MKPKKNVVESTENSKQVEREEFFQLPRAEDLLPELRQEPAQQIGDLVINVPYQMEGRFTMQASDDSMKGADIRRGDYMVIQRKNRYLEGSILVVQLGTKQLVRRYFSRGGRIHLQSDPPSKQIIIVEKETPNFQILGQVIQIIREIKE